jgi:hypothetical protein
VFRHRVSTACGVFAVFVSVIVMAARAQAIIEDTGSTNRPGVRVTVDRDGNATVEQRGSETHHVQLPKEFCDRLIQGLEATPVASLPKRHCAKSVSFGSSLFVEFEGNRSPDLSCPGASDSRVEALQKHANEVLDSARQILGNTTGRAVR